MSQHLNNGNQINKQNITSCFSCEYGDKLDFQEEKKTGKQMFCRKKWTPIMYNEYEKCGDFQPFKYIGMRTYLGGSCSGK